MKEVLKNLLIIFMCIYCVIFNSTYVFANNSDDEDINVQEIIQTYAQTVEDELEINSKIAVAYDRTSGRVIWGKDEDKRSAMASTTKIMTAIVTLENANLNDMVTVSSKAANIGGSTINLKTGDVVKLEDLLYGLMLRSGNDSAIAIAEYVGGSVEGFAEIMNAKAAELNLKDTHFITPHGLDDPEHYTTAKELAIIADYALGNQKFAEIVGTKTCIIRINNYPKEISNTNELLGELNGVNGVKTGFTNNAGRCLVTSINRNGWEIIVVVLRADTKKMRTQDSVKIIEYIYKYYQQVDIGKIVREKFENWSVINKDRIFVNKAKRTKIELELEDLENKIIPVKNNDVDKIDIEVNSLFYFQAPIEVNTVFGNLKVFLNTEVIEVLNIYNTNKVNKKQVEDYLIQFLSVFTNI